MKESHRGTEPRTPMERFNRVYSSIQNITEHFYNMPPYPMYKQKITVVATMVLRNFIPEHGGENEDFARFDHDPTFTSTIPKRYNKCGSSSTSDGSTSAINVHDELATTLPLAWNWLTKFIILILHVNLQIIYAKKILFSSCKVWLHVAFFVTVVNMSKTVARKKRKGQKRLFEKKKEAKKTIPPEYSLSWS